MHLVSIVVPVFNGERFVVESLDSILAQTYPNIEVIVVDDASTDSTADILAAYGDRIRVIRQPETRGIYANANTGIEVARGEYIGVFHADDVYLPEMVEREVAWLEAHPNAGAVFSGVSFIDTDGRRFGAPYVQPTEVAHGGPVGYADVLNTLLTYKNRFLACPTALVRARAYRELGGYNQDVFKNTSDLEMWLRIARANYPLGVLREPLLLYRRGHGSSSERYQRFRTDQERFFTILDLELDEHSGRAIATEAALRSYEAHRAQDTLMRAVSHYILGDRETARRVLRGARLGTIARGRHIQRWRMLVLALALRILLRVPRFTAVASVFERRWYGRATSAGQR
jgi:glycosyltransferase involved in cell wall biosynthesis